MSEKNYNYETKCRRCGELTDWHFAPVDSIRRVDFINAMGGYLRNPRPHRCEKCEKETIQDVVAWSPPEGE